MRFRTLAAVIAAALALTGLTGCRTTVGTAATVDGHRITESQVDEYLTATGANAEVAANSGSTPRSQVLQFLIQERIFENTLKSFGELPSDRVLDSFRDEAARLLLQTDLRGNALVAALRKGLPNGGIRAKFADVYLRVQELEYAIIQSRQLTQLPELIALVREADIDVSVNPRYGKWDRQRLSLDPKGSIPSYLEVQEGPGGGQNPLPVN